MDSWLGPPVPFALNQGEPELPAGKRVTEEMWGAAVKCPVSNLILIMVLNLRAESFLEVGGGRKGQGKPGEEAGPPPGPAFLAGDLGCVTTLSRVSE